MYELEKNHWAPEVRTLCLACLLQVLVLHQDFRLLLGSDTGRRMPQIVLFYVRSDYRALAFETKKGIFPPLVHSNTSVYHISEITQLILYAD